MEAEVNRLTSIAAHVNSGDQTRKLSVHDVGSDSLFNRDPERILRV